MKITDKYGAEIYKFYRAGITVGSDAQGTFHPTSNIKRSEVAAIVLRMYDADMKLFENLSLEQLQQLSSEGLGIIKERL